MGRRRAALALIALGALAGGCRRAGHPAARGDEAPELPAVCDRLAQEGEFPLAAEDDSAEGAVVARTPRGVVAAWLEHPSAGGAVVALRPLRASGAPAGAARRAIELAPPPVPSAPPSLAFADGAGWVLGWDEQRGCQLAGFDATGAARGHAARAVTASPCFNLAVAAAGGPSALVASPEGWRAERLEGRAGSASGAIVAPPGDRWLARALDGVTAYATDGREVWVRRPGAPAGRRVAEVPAQVSRLALERVGDGYLLAWAQEGSAGTALQRLGDDLAPRGEAERFPVGGAGLAIARVGPEAWVAMADAAGALAVVRQRGDERAPGLDAVRAGTITSVAIAPTAGGAVVVYSADRGGRRGVFALGARCAAGEGPRAPR